MTSIQVEIKKKIGKPKKQPNRIVQTSNNKKKQKMFGSNLEYGHKNETNTNTNNNIKTIHKLREEINNYKIKSQKLEDEIIQLNLKLKEMTEKKEKIKKNKKEEKNSEDNENC